MIVDNCCGRRSRTSILRSQRPERCFRGLARDGLLAFLAESGLTSEVLGQPLLGSGGEGHLPAAPPRRGLYTDGTSALDRAAALILMLGPRLCSLRMNQMGPSNLATRHHSGNVSDGV